MHTLTAGSVEHHLLREENLLRWLYLGRMTLVSGIFVGAILAGVSFVETGILFALSLVWTSVSFWRTHLAEREASFTFRYGQVLFDILVVTGIVHFTGGAESSFAPLYILVISEGALLLPLPGGVLVGLAASAVFAGDAVLLLGADDTEVTFLLQIGLFTVVAVVTGILGDRLRQAGMRLGAVESELEQLRLDTSDILDNLSTGVMTIDGHGRLAYLNPAGAEMLGLDPEEWFGAPVLDTVDGIAPGLGGMLARSIHLRMPQTRFKTTMADAGRTVTLGVSTTVLERSSSEVPSATAIFQDITVEERAERLDRRTQRLEAVAALSASLAHEIKNPLASIRSSVEQLARKDGLADEDRAVLERLVLDESDRLSRLLSDFIEFSAIRMGDSETHEFGELVADAIKLAAQHPDATGVELECRGQDRSIMVPGDRDLLHRAVYNLVLNAFQFAGDGGRVEVELDDVAHLRADQTAGVECAVRLYVHDSGPGIDARDEEKIFDPFFTRRIGGSGLGLAVVQRAVRAHDGAVLVGNHPAGGAEFTLFLPGNDARRVVANDSREERGVPA
ncbi:MAG: ATP-binding protein [Longimicrobiales bacterium]|nr:ATP-binding protein [Longimicrobiales bacterium]